MISNAIGIVNYNLARNIDLSILALEPENHYPNSMWTDRKGLLQFSTIKCSAYF